jgi:hypothetical protein
MMAENGNSLFKWSAGIAGSIVAALIIWMLTKPGGVLDSGRPPTPKVDARLILFDVGTCASGGTARGEFSVYNEGDKAGENCHVRWFSGDQTAAALTAGQEPTSASMSPPFGLLPKQPVHVVLESLPYQKPGTFPSQADVICETMDTVESVPRSHDVVVTGQ